MTTDFTYNGYQILSNGPFKPNGKDMPNDARTRVECYADIATIPNPYVGLKITVKVDETNNNKMTDYIVKSLKANSMGIANSAIDQVQRYVDYLGANGQVADTNNFATKEELGLKADKTELHSHTNKTVLDGITSANVNNWNNKVDKVEGKTLTTNDYTNEEKQTVANLKATVGDTSSGLVKDVRDLKTNGVSQDNINVAIENYLTEHPVQSGATTEQAAQIQANTAAIGTEELPTTAKTLKGAIAETFQSVSNGKTLIASAITDKGITTSNNDTFQVMADNISKINSVITDVNINSYNILKDNWKFKLLSNNGTDTSYTNEISQNYDDSTFENISVPHDWAIYKEFNSSSPGSYEGGYLDGGDGVYRIKLDTTSLNGQKVFLYFDGIFMESEVYINGNLIGLNKWYNPFYFDITNNLNFDGNDTLAVLVRVKQPCSRWYSGAGIFRNVYLVTGNYIDVAIDSIHVTTPNLETELTKGYATTNVKMSINNKNEESKNINIKNEIYFNNELVAYNNEIKQLSNGNNEYTCNILVPSPKLWHEYQGNLYTLKTIIQIDGVEVYTNYTKYGYRYFKFDKDTGFWLNGINMKLRGVCLHHDLGCLGAEVNKSAIERQIRILKNMGCNAIRITHNPASTELLEICAKEGMLLIEELFDCWANGKKAYDFARFFNEYRERVIKFTVNRGKNNPAIIMYSVGNEIIRTSGGKYTAETATALVSNMINTIKAIDTERMVTMGEDVPGNPIARAVMQLMDVVGVNYGNDAEYASLREVYPEFKVYGSETTSALSSRGIYARDNINLQCSSKDNDFVDWGDSASVALKRHMDSDYLAGMFIWTGFDYIGEPTPFNKYPARSSYFGIIDLAGFPKDIYYMYQSRWTKKPMIHVFPHWNWENGNTVNVWLYSNCDKVELFVNGVSKGIKTKDNIGSKYNYEYNVSYEAGTLLAKGMDSAGNVLVQEEIKTSSAPYKISLTSDKSLIKQGGDDLIFVECNVLDENDIVCRTANNLINFSVSGGTIVGTDNGDATDVSTSLRHPNRKLFNGKALCVVKPDNTDTDVIITATSDGLQETSINVKKSQITAYANSIVKIPGDIEAPLPPIINYATGISFNNNTVTLQQTRQYQLEITLMGGDVYDSITYSANNENVSVTSSGLVTGNTLGESIITVTMIANEITYEDTCTITVTENTIGVLYNLESPTVFDGTNFIDTGVCARDTDKNLTIFISYNGKTGDPGEQQVCVMHAMLESDGYPGLAIDTVERNYRIAAYGNNYYLLDDNNNKINYTECSSEQKICIRITSGSNTINVKYKIEGRTASVKTKDMTMGTATFNNTILLGAYRDISDVKGRYWKGTINSFTVYDKVLTDEEVNALFESEPPLPPTPPTPPTPPATDTDDYTALDISNIQQGQPFTLYDGALDLNNQTVFADITLDDSLAKQNVLSIGMNIDQWENNGIKLHCYYPESTTNPIKRIEMDLNNFGPIRESVNITNNVFKIALNVNGIYVNGTKIDNLSQDSNFTSLVAQKTAQIGSLQGDTRSKATYNRVGIYNRLLNNEELITLTSIDA